MTEERQNKLDQAISDLLTSAGIDEIFYQMKKLGISNVSLAGDIPKVVFEKQDGADAAPKKDPQDRFRDGSGNGFTVSCNHCGSKNVHLDNSLEWYPGDGEWGDVTLKCWDCNKEIKLLDGISDRR